MTDLSYDASKNNQTGSLFVVSAPSGAGKTSLVRALMETTDNTGVAVSHTTRPQRPEEQNGVNYYFTDEASFKQMVDDGQFLEWANVFGHLHLYGTSIPAANLVLSSGKHLILEIDWQGAAQIREKNPATQSIFILPPSLKALRDRLEGRAQDDEATVDKRMDAAFDELSHYGEFDFLIVNDDFESALSELKAVIAGKNEKARLARRLPELEGLIRDLLPQLMP